MKTREEIFDVYLNLYSSDIKVKKIINPFYVPDEQSILDSIKSTEEKYRQSLPEIALSDSEIVIVSNKIKAIHSVYQEEGDALLGDYTHDYKWYEDFLNAGNEEYYWERYKTYLAVQKHFAPEVIKTLENDTLRKIMSYLGNPNEESGFSVRGLVVGDVQSGKTSNYLGLITKAADAGYKVIFILTGTIESLRKQTQIRVEEGFVGYDVVSAVDVGVGRGDKTPKSFTSRLKDFVADDDQNTNIKISNYPSEPMIFVVKKNASVLSKLYTSLKNINTTKQYQQIKAPMLLIDDEADNASINTRKPEDDPTKINKYIRNILKLFSRSSYVGFTATPFANVFISYESKYIQVNAKNYGIPQNRPRLLMMSVYVGNDEILRGKIKEYFDSLGKTEEKVIEIYKKSKYYQEKQIKDLLRIDNDPTSVLWKEALECTPNDTVSRRKIWQENPEIVHKDGMVTDEKFIRTITTKQDRHPNSGNIYFDSGVAGRGKFRYLTPRECLLFMGFEDKDYESLQANNPEQRVKSKLFPRDKIIRMAGNSIPVKMLEGFFYQLYKIEPIMEGN